MAPRARSEAPRGDAPESARIAGRYEVQEVVGRGGMGAVYRVRDAISGRTVALKRLHVRSRRKNELLAHFEREFLTLAQLRHPRIIEVHDYGVDQHGAYYTMELLSGHDLRTVAPIDWRLACNYLREVATSLALLHARGLVHRDVTPQNVRVGEDGHCKLIDFGALAEVGRPGEMIGTPPCMPPEALDAVPIDSRQDLYALGALGYYLLTGHHAYPATDSRQLRAFWNTPPPAPSAARSRAEAASPAATAKAPAASPIPAALDALVMALMSLDAMARPSSAGAVIDRLDAILGGDVVEEASLAESYLASAPLCGRKPELQKATAALERVRRGRGAALLLTGPSGVGRTRLLTEVGLRSKLYGCVVLQVDAAAHDGPYAPVLALAAQLAQRLPEQAAGYGRELVRLQPAQARALQQLAPELAVQVGVRMAPSARPTAATAEPTRERALCVAAFHGLFAEVAKEQPLALLVDDAHRADEASLSVLGSLAHESRRLKLLVAAARRSGDEALCDSALRALEHCSSVVELGALNDKQLLEWLSAVFGDAPNLVRLCSFLHERTRGRAAAVAALLRFLIARGELAHRDGTWALPNEPAKLTLPADAEHAALEQLDALPEATRSLAEALSMHRGALSAELCATLCDPSGTAAPEPATMQAPLDALVTAEVLTHHAGGYRFASESLRETLEARIEPALRTALHRRLADAILARKSEDPLDQLAAGVHLLEARDDRGLALASGAAVLLNDRVEGISGALRLLERALVLAREAGAPAAHRLAILGALGIGAYVADHRLARYTNEIGATLDEATGMARGARWYAAGEKLGQPFAWLGGLLGLGVSLLWFYTQPKRARPAGFRVVARWGIGALTALVGRAAICLDKPEVDRLVAWMKPARALGLRDPGGFCVAYCSALGVATRDNFTATRTLWLKLEAILRRPGAMQEVPLEQRRLWHGGVAYALGLFESFRGDPNVLRRAEELEASGSDMHAMIAAQLRLQYHGFRGEAEQVRREFARMEACAIQVGSSWQVETWSAISINLFASLWHDVIFAKQAMRETQRVKGELPSLTRYAVTSEALYLVRRGQPRDAVALYEPLLAAEPPLSRIGWCTSHGILADAYNQLGQHDKALEVCERVLALADPRDRAYFAMRIDLDLPYAVALDALGHHERAVAHLEMLLECYSEYGSPLALGSVHETLARIWFARGDRKRFTDHLKQVEAYFTKLGNPALIARFQALGDLVGEGGGVLTKVAVMREVRAFEAAVEPIVDRNEGSRAVLAWLMRTCEGYDGYLFAAPDSEDEEPVLVAATSDREPAADVFEAVAESMQSFGGAADTTNFGTGAATRTRRDGAASHVYLLSFVEADAFHAEGALVLLGRAPNAPPVRYELLQAAAQQLRRLGEAVAA